MMFGHLIPMIGGEDGYVGSLLQSARGYRAFGDKDREIGTYPTVEAGAAGAALDLTGQKFWMADRRGARPRQSLQVGALVLEI